MHDIQTHHFPQYQTAFADLSPLHGSVRAVLAGTAPGRLRVDDPDDSSAALLEGPEGLYLGGRPSTDRDYAGLRAAIPDWAYLYPSVGWQGHLHLALPHAHMQAHDRVHLVAAVEVRPLPALPAGLVLAPETDGPITCAVLFDGAVVARCQPDLRVGDYIELGVWTRADMRRLGLARAVVQSCIDLAARAGIARIGWHCHASNRGSLRVAEQVGFVLAGHYRAWSASLPAENEGDLSPDACRVLAPAFEAGRHDIGWLDFHAACAWAQAGEAERALMALERLVAGPWQGEADWLETSWALAPLRPHGRFEAAVVHQRRK